jgi:hypothetical protein
MGMDLNNNLPGKNGQFGLNFNTEPAKAPEKVELKDSKGRTRKDVINESKIINPDIVASITFENGQFYIQKELADKWISRQDGLDEKNKDSYSKGQY